MFQAQAEAGNRAGQTEHCLQWQDTEPECMWQSNLSPLPFCLFVSSLAKTMFPAKLAPCGHVSIDSKQRHKLTSMMMCGPSGKKKRLRKED